MLRRMAPKKAHQKPATKKPGTMIRGQLEHEGVDDEPK